MNAICLFTYPFIYFGCRSKESHRNVNIFWPGCSLPQYYLPVDWLSYSNTQFIKKEKQNTFQFSIRGTLKSQYYLINYTTEEIQMRDKHAGFNRYANIKNFYLGLGCSSVVVDRPWFQNQELQNKQNKRIFLLGLISLQKGPNLQNLFVRTMGQEVAKS